MRRNKFGAIPTLIDGIRFDSKGEAKHYADLKYRVMAKEISDLKLQVRFPLEVNGKLICTYIADFTYMEDGKFVVSDFKGIRTPVFNIKAKLFEALNGYKIRISK